MTLPAPRGHHGRGRRHDASVYQKVLGIDLKAAVSAHAVRRGDGAFRRRQTRYPIRHGALKNLGSAFSGTSFKVFCRSRSRAARVFYGIAVPGAHQLSRKRPRHVVDTLKVRHQMGLAWIKANPDGWQGPIAKYLGETEKNLATKLPSLKTGDTMLMVAGDADKVRPILGDLRLQLGARFNLPRDRRAQISVGCRFSRSSNLMTKKSGFFSVKSSVHRAQS